MKTGQIVRMFRTIGKYEFRNINWEKDQNLNKTLIVGTSAEIPGSIVPKEKIFFPNGKVAFEVVAPK